MARRSEAEAPETRPWGEARGGLIRRTIAGGARMLGVAPRPPAVAPRAEPVPPAIAPPAAPAALTRRAWADRLWGEGMVLPGGAAELLRLAALLPLSPEATLLLAGGGAQAAGAVVAGARGCFVAAHEPGAAAAKPGRGRVAIEGFDAAAPAFRAGFHHHALLLEPFRAGGTPDALLAAAATALRPGGQMVLLDLVARGGSAGPWESRWLGAEGRAATPPAEAAIPAALQRAGFDLHVVEDAGRRQRDAVLEAWQALILALRGEAARPAPRDAVALVEEAEAWLLRLRLMQEGRLRLLRWHATMARPPG
ncbi:hypothetical protein [Neoroseomonas oryzicola]|uniref:Class I SAM-dependent methyltransferase n=2 Tax=Neoroseomonas oryzicola TaxID=535904 RepID=A0ABX1EHM5_9PROT|nr:hypothetical protein [Neoroseomonas oryzicola]NKE16911.1 hypothetical protein [Neoroseomonas oryzicola]